MWSLSDADIASIEERARRTLGTDGPVGALRLSHVEALCRDLRELHKLRARLIVVNRQAQADLERTPAL